MSINGGAPSQATATESRFDQWALVELMGHQRIVGRVTEQAIGGGSFLRVDVPGPDGEIRFTRFYGHSAIYAINPIERDLAIHLAKRTSSEPVHAYELPAPAAAHDPEPVIDSRDPMNDEEYPYER